MWRLPGSDENTINDLVNTVRSGETTDADRAIDTATHILIDRVTGEYERWAYNTAVAAFMEFTNSLYKYVQSDDGPHGETLAFAVDTLLQLMAPAVPHISAELWAMRHDGEHIHTLTWPVADPARLVISTVTMVIQVNGKVRDRVDVDAEISDVDAEALAMSSDRVNELLDGREPKRVIVRAPNLVNVVG